MGLRTTILAGVCTALASCLAGGCAPDLPPSEDAILRYLRNARVQGKVRRVWPEGQAYVNAVLKAHAELQKEVSPLYGFADVFSLWPRDDPRWQDQAALAERLAAIAEALEGTQPKRETALDKLGEVIEKAPKDLDTTTPGAEAAFMARVWDALSMDQGEDLKTGRAIEWFETAAAAHRDLVRATQAGADDFDPDHPGLRFKSPSHQREIDEHYDALVQGLRDALESTVRTAEQDLMEITPRLRTIDKREQKYEYEYLTYRSDYRRATLEQIPKDLRERVHETRKELEKAQDVASEARAAEKSKADAKAAFLKRRIEELSEEQKQWQGRVGAILERIKQTAGGADDTDAL